MAWPRLTPDTQNNPATLSQSTNKPPQVQSQPQPQSGVTENNPNKSSLHFRSFVSGQERENFHPSPCKYKLSVRLHLLPTGWDLTCWSEFAGNFNYLNTQVTWLPGPGINWLRSSMLWWDICEQFGLPPIWFEGSKVTVFTGSICCLLLSVRHQVSDKILGGGKRSQVLISRRCWATK